MGGRLRNRRRLAAVLPLPLLLICAAPSGAEAQQFVCRPIVRGDTVSGLARQLTGNTRAAYTHAFQLRDPARRMFVPKSQYHRPLSTSWEACVAIEPVNVPLAHAPVVASGATAPSEPVVSAAASGGVPALPVPPSGSSPARIIVIVLIGLVLAPTLLCLALGVSLTPRPVPPVLQRAGEEFVHAFARPLIDSSSRVPPIHTRLRFVRHIEQLEIAIAPGAGRRYPNLADHKTNVEYDVNRVMQALGTHVVVSDRLRAAGKWVVVPIRLTGRSDRRERSA